jgi:hypothetical protein
MAIVKHIEKNSKVVGYFSYDSSGKVFCAEGVCIVAGSEELTKTYLRKMTSKNPDRLIIKKIRFGEIMHDMQEGVKYSFDKEAYNRFLPLAKANGIENLLSGDVFLNEPSTGLDFITVGLAGF